MRYALFVNGFLKHLYRSNEYANAIADMMYWQRRDKRVSVKDCWRLNNPAYALESA